MSSLLRAPHAALCLLLFATGVSAQIAEIEPNHPCPLAQDLGDPARPFFVAGSLDSTDEEPDVDFYLGAGAPGEILLASADAQAKLQEWVPDVLARLGL